MGNMISEKTLAMLARRGVVTSQGSHAKEGAATSQPSKLNEEVDVVQEDHEVPLEAPGRKRSRGERLGAQDRRVTVNRPESTLKIEE